MAEFNNIARSAINHSGLFSDTSNTLSPFEIFFSFKNFASFKTLFLVSDQVYV